MWRDKERDVLIVLESNIEQLQLFSACDCVHVDVINLSRQIHSRLSSPPLSLIFKTVAQQTLLLLLSAMWWHILLQSAHLLCLKVTRGDSTAIIFHQPPKLIEATVRFFVCIQVHTCMHMYFFIVEVLKSKSFIEWGVLSFCVYKGA